MLTFLENLEIIWKKILGSFGSLLMASLAPPPSFVPSFAVVGWHLLVVFALYSFISITSTLEVKLPYQPSCPSVGWLVSRLVSRVGQNFPTGRKDRLSMLLSGHLFQNEYSYLFAYMCIRTYLLYSV